MLARIRQRPGQSTIEFALVSTIMFTLIFGIMEGGRLLFTYHQVTNASREGARYAVARGIAGDSQVGQGNYEELVSEVTSRTTGLNADALIVTAVWPGDPNAVGPADDPRCPVGSNEAGCPVRVTVEYEFEPIIAMFSGWGTIGLSSSSEMRIHY